MFYTMIKHGFFFTNQGSIYIIKGYKMHINCTDKTSLQVKDMKRKKIVNISSHMAADVHVT